MITPAAVRRAVSPFVVLSLIPFLCASPGVTADAAGAEQATARLKDAPANTWLKISSEPTGARDWPMFHYVPDLDRFALTAGGLSGPAHFDTEFLDLGAATWTNAYPEGSPYKTESGPTDAPGIDIRENQPALKADKNGVIRILRALNPYVRDPNPYFQSTYDADAGKLYAYFQDGTLVFDPKRRLWTDLKVPKFSKCRDSWLLYGSLAYDPVNKEILSIGGTSDEDGGTPGTWVFSVAAGAWWKLSPGSNELKALNAEVKVLHARLAAFINACRNRFYLTETDAEAKRDLAVGANDLAAAVEQFTRKLNVAKLTGLEAGAAKMAAVALDKVGPALKTLGGRLSGRFSGDTLVEAGGLLEAVLRAKRSLDPEPCGRAVSQMATCAARGKIVLFGGCLMDGFIADTWVYDCKTRTWEQRWPKVCPAPRGGHILAALPKSGKVVLYGAAIFSSGYGVPHGNPRPPQDLWTYDVDANEWRLLAAPGKDSPLDVVGAVDANDVLVAIGRDSKNRQGRVTWAMKVDPSAPDAGAEKAGVAPGSVMMSFDTPADFDRAAKPDSDAMATLLKELPANKWTLMPAPPRRINPHPWGTCPYDTVRHQLISFGGGHSAAHYNDVAHYGIRTATWSIGFPEEFPFANASFKAMFNQTFNNHPTVPTHVWDSAAFDEVSGKAVFCVRGGTWVYDPATRSWEYPPVWVNGGGTKNSMKGTPKGVVYWGASGELQLYDAKNRAWSQLPINGGKLAPAYCDTSGICYDSKRRCLWLAHDGSPMVCYDIESGALTAHSTPGAPENIAMRETAYIPELDVLLNAGRVKGPDGQTGNLAYDIENKKWIGIEMPCTDGQTRINDKDYSSISLSIHYDPGLKIAVFHSNTQEILVARIDKVALKTFAVKFREPKKK